MVIHDMRNPTNSIEFAVKEVLRLLFQAMTAGSDHGQGDATIRENQEMDQSCMNWNKERDGNLHETSQIGIPSWKQKSPNFIRVCIKP